jgi:hypothetical protein
MPHDPRFFNMATFRERVAEFVNRALTEGGVP